MKPDVVLKALGESVDGLYAYVFYPQLRLLLPSYFGTLSLRRRIRFLGAYIAGYKVFYLGVPDENGKTGEMAVEYMIQRGNDFRYPYSDKRDIWIGPAFVRESYRGHGYQLYVQQHFINKEDYRFAYGYVKKDNIPSFKTLVKDGYEIISDARVTPILRRVRPCAEGKGNFYIMRRTKEKEYI